MIAWEVGDAVHGTLAVAMDTESLYAAIKLLCQILTNW